jgi:hypothetical protein
MELGATGQQTRCEAKSTSHCLAESKGTWVQCFVHSTVTTNCGYPAIHQVGTTLVKRKYDR